MDAEIIKTIERFKGRKLVVVGDIILDQYLSGDVNRISPEAPIPILRERRRERRLGGAAYVASLIKGLGAEVDLAGVVGDDREGEEILRLGREQGIDMGGVMAADGRPTTLKTRLVGQRQQMLRVDREEDAPFKASLVKAVLGQAADAADNADALVLSDYDKGLFGDKAVTGLVRRWRRAGRPVLADFKPANWRNFCGVTLATPNQAEASAMAGMALPDGKSLEKAGAKLVKMLSAQGVVITRGEDGMALFQAGKKTQHLATTAREVFDVTGAGDAVVAMMALALASGADLSLAARLANLAGGVAVGKLGAAMLSVAELRSAAAALEK